MPGLSRASTPSIISTAQDVDGRDKPGHDEYSHPVHRYRNLGAVLDGLVDHAITFGKFQQQIELVLRRVGIDIETETDFREADRGLLVDAECAAKIEIALGGHEAGLQWHLDRG